MIPVVDIGCLRQSPREDAAVMEMARALSEACRHHGFFYLTGHGIDPQLTDDLEELSHQFFELKEREKMEISMDKGGRAWRGYFPIEGELTSGMPDLKEGIYFGAELNQDDSRVLAGLPMHGSNLFPIRPEGFKDVVVKYITEVTKVGHLVMEAIALSLGLDGGYFRSNCTYDPLVLFRVFHYPPQQTGAAQWGVGEHTDYGLLTLLLQDSVGGLQVKSGGEWIDAPPLSGTFVCNIGDMLDRMTGGLYRSTPHRVLNSSGKQRLSFPLFFDPSFDAKVKRIEGIDMVDDDRNERWDKSSVHDFEGTYGVYLMRKVSSVFPQLRQNLQ